MAVRTLMDGHSSSGGDPGFSSEFIQDRTMRLRKNQESISVRMFALGKEIEERRAASGRKHLQYLRDLIERQQGIIIEILTVAGSLPSSSPLPGTPNHPKLLKEINDLVQSLPTVPSLPSTKEGRIIRGIVAILRTHNVPGIEGVTQEGVRNKDGTHTPELGDALKIALDQDKASV